MPLQGLGFPADKHIISLRFNKALCKKMQNIGIIDAEDQDEI